MKYFVNPLRRPALRSKAIALLIGGCLGTLPYNVGVAETAASGLALHRAAYVLELDHAGSGSSVVGVSGGMSYEFGDGCDGWTTHQRYLMRLTYSDGQENELNANYVNWEAKDGKRYTFNVRRERTGEPPVEIEGLATLPADGGDGVAEFEWPENQEFELPERTFFPVAHTAMLIEKAKSGTRFDNSLLFDGGEQEGATTVTAVIGKLRDAPEDAARMDALGPQPVYPLSFAFFPYGAEATQPDFEMTLFMQANGVVPTLVLDYTDFRVRAKLVRIEALPSPDC